MMTELTLTASEMVELRSAAEVADPPRKTHFHARDTRPSWYQPATCSRAELEAGLPHGAVGYTYLGPITDLGSGRSDVPDELLEPLGVVLAKSQKPEAVSLRAKLTAAAQKPIVAQVENNG